jgi:RNA polymerase sigma factor (sigma-70 family)
MIEENNGPRAGEERRLYGEFAQFYTSERCPWAPANPRRAFNMAFRKVYPEFSDRLSREQTLAAAYETLGYRGAPRPGLFETFDPDKYTGTRPLEEHFLSLFARKLTGKLKALLRRTTDSGRSGDRGKFRPDPDLGLLREDVRVASEEERLMALPAVLACLSPRERAVVHLLYWGDLSAHKAGKLLELSHKTVCRAHRSALAKLRRLYGLEENLAA